VGPSGLELLLLDLRSTGAETPDPALKTVSGYALSEWNTLWRANLREEPPRDPREETRKPLPVKDPLRFARGTRLGDLLLARGHSEAARREFQSALEAAPAEPSIHWRLARTCLLLGDDAAFRTALGDRDKLRAADGGWLALSSRALREDGHAAEAAEASEHALGLDPLLEDVACEGAVRAPGGSAPLPADPDRRALCESARTPPQ